MDESPLSKIVTSTEAAVSERETTRPVDLCASSRFYRAGRRSFIGALRHPGVSIIAEFKRASPSSGILAKDRDIQAMVRAYEAGGARAISILTESTKFRGSQEDLTAAREACSLPVLCKDFILRDYQVHEAASFGADAVLLIAAILPAERLGRLLALARDLALDVLVEIRNEEELSTAIEVGADLIGINNRDLGRLTIDLDTTRALIGLMPKQVTTVSESGLESPRQVVELAQLGVDAALVGTTLMKAVDPEQTCRALSEASNELIQQRTSIAAV
jgi:indole-3-glycerol phosphate synthase